MIYSIELFKEIFAEGEIMVMTDDFFLALKPLMDDRVSSQVLEFFKSFDASDISTHPNAIAKKLTQKVNRMRELLMPTILLNTFHFDVRDRGVSEFVQKLNIDTLMENVSPAERPEAIEKLSWLLQNRKYWNPKIEPRKKEDFDKFLKQCKFLAESAYYQEFDLQRFDLPVVKRYANLIERVMHNRIFFYEANEKERSTHMSLIMGRARDIEISLHGLIYQTKCSGLGISKIDRRSFLINKI